jgi:hypothetical protein
MNLLQKQPNEWSCLPTSLAMLVGLPVEDIIPKYGHDGSAPVPGNPYDRLCFTDLETVKVALGMGVHLVPVHPYSRISRDGVEHWMNDPTFVRTLERFSGLVVGSKKGSGRGYGHSVCWHNGLFSFLDPSKPEAVFYGQSDERYNVEVFYAWVNRPLI